MGALESPADGFVTRGELRDVRADVHDVRERVAIVENKQNEQTATLAKILTAVERGQSIRAMFIAGGSGIGGGIVAGAAYLLHWLSQ